MDRIEKLFQKQTTFVAKKMFFFQFSTKKKTKFSSPPMMNKKKKEMKQLGIVFVRLRKFFPFVCFLKRNVKQKHKTNIRKQKASMIIIIIKGDYITQ